MLTIVLIAILNTGYAQTSLDSSKKELVDNILQSYCNPNEPGMAIGIVRNGKVIYKNSIGIADISNNISISDSTVFNIASVSKQFTALLALMAVEDEKVLLEDDITQYLPELKDLPYTIKINQLANHTHGLPNNSDLISLIGFDLASPISNDQALQTLLNIEQVNFQAGTEYQYGNSGFILLAEILDRVYEKSFPLLIKEKIFEPLNMTHTAVINDPNTVIYNKAIAYKKINDAYKEHPSRQMESGASNIHTTLSDLLKWAINLQKQTIGNKNQIDHLKAQTVSISRNSDLSYGLGLFTETYKQWSATFQAARLA